MAAKMASGWSGPKSIVRWGSRHAVANAVIRVGRRTGDPYSRLCGDPALHEDPYGFYDEIRAAEVVAGKFALVTARHDVISDILRSPEEFHCGFPEETLPRGVRALVSWARDPAVMNGGDRPAMLVSNGAEHARYRRLATRAFTARAVAALAQRIEELAAELLDTMARPNRDGVMDLVAEFAEVLPVLVVAEVLGVPASMRRTFLDWAHPIVPLTDLGVGYREFRRAEASLRQLNTWLRAHFARLRQDPGPDLLSRIVVAAQQEDGITDLGLMVNSSLLLLAGFETTVNLLGTGAVLLMSHPDQLAKLRADPFSWDNAVDEILRFDSPVQSLVRYSPKPVAVRGIPMRRGQLVMLLTGGANRDPAVFHEPNVFDVTRTNAREHLSLSLGPHFCVGAALARLQGEIGLRMLFDRFPDIALAGRVKRRPTRVARGFASIPVRLGAADGGAASSGAGAA